MSDDPRRLLKPRIYKAKTGDWWNGPLPWRLDVPDQGSAHLTMTRFGTYEAAHKALADWWAHGNRASFLRHPGHGHDRRREALQAARRPETES